MGASRRFAAVRTAIMAGLAGFFVLAWSASFESCAHTASPRGGPPDTIPPALIIVEPDSLAVLPGFEGDVRFEFDEAISERGIQGAVLLYPFDPRPRVRKGGRDLKVRPRVGWSDNRIYHIHIEPVVQDLFRNSIPRPIEYVFSTGAAITTNRVTGTVFDRMTGNVLPGGRVDMVMLPDSLRYGAASDSAGDFTIERLPAGRYLAIGYEDRNQDRKATNLDRTDTLEITLSDTDVVSLDFEVFKHDTIGSEIARVRSLDSLTLELQFNGFLDPDSLLTLAMVRVTSLAMATAVPLDTVLHNWQYQAWRQERLLAEGAAADSAAAAADSLAPADTVDVRVLPLDGAPAEAGEAPEAEPLPTPRIIVVLAAALAPGDYLVRVDSIVNLSGFAATSEFSYRHEEAEDGQDADDR